MNFKLFIKDKIGIDRAIFYTLLNRTLSISTAVFTIVFIIKFLSSDQQGYYYTFGSIVALQVFFELGLTGIITQFVAHEAAHLTLFDNGTIEGEYKYKSRLSSLIHFCAKWYSYISVALLALLLIAGITFFSHYSDTDGTTNWEFPWILLSVGTVLNFLITPIVSITEGMGRVKDIAKYRLILLCFNPVIIWGGLACELDLYVLGIFSSFQALLMMVMIFNSPSGRLLKSFWNMDFTESISYKNEIFPYQWRIAVSWISGYFIFQLFNPVLFATEGAVVAGQMGMTIQSLNAIQAFALAWITTKVPRISGLIAQHEYEALDKLFNKTMKQLVCLGTLALIGFVATIYAFQSFDLQMMGMKIGGRFLPIIPLVLMAWSVFAMFPINCWAIYLRSHKKEPLMKNSMVMGILCCISTFTCGHLWGLYGIVIGFALLRIVSLVWVHRIYVIKRLEYRKK